MKKRTLLVAAAFAAAFTPAFSANAVNAMASAPAMAGVPGKGPLPKDLYIRGGFNGWNTDNALVHRGAGIYEAQVLVSPGYHGFKVGSGDWSSEWVIAPQASVTVAPGADYALQTRAGAEGYLLVKQTALYRFRLNVSDPARPLLRVVREDAPASKAIDPHLGHAASASLVFPTYDGKAETVRFSTPDAGAPLRSYAQSTTMALRDPGPQYALFQEGADLPTVRSGSLAFDALFALAASEMRQNAVAEIKDGNYNGGAAVPCNCFATGEKWHYVWTRDLSYAADLGLAMLDPQRVRNSLDFKLSPYRSGLARAPQIPGSADGLQIIQDTGSGGSWPVSTDRVAWAFGAERALANLAPAERQAFAARALKALINTLEIDRVAVFDTAMGLYGGEQSFLDWRDQSYAAWIVDDLAAMSSAKALSTNVAHYKALTLASTLAREQGDHAHAGRYAGWARALKEAINDKLWLADAGMYSSLTAGHFDNAPLHKFDWLGQSLAIVTGIADRSRARSILAHYPHGPMGAPVIFPQQAGMPVYHNRALWPFVTAYGLQAAALSGNVSVADAAYASLMRGAALNLSNMENLEWLSGQPLLLDEKNPQLIGPVINSRRQLWSVGGYLGMVLGNVFGVSTSTDGLLLRPFITATLRRDTFAGSSQLLLNDLRVGGKLVKVRIALPPATQANGYYAVAAVSVDGKRASQKIAWSALGAASTIDITLGALVQGQQAMRRVSADPYSEDPAVFAPPEPKPGEATAPGVQLAHYRHGLCESHDAAYTGSGNRSHHSQPRCSGEAIEVAASAASPEAPSKAPLNNWGAPADVLETGKVTVHHAGEYQLQLRYTNTANQINLGISGGVKWVSLRDAGGKVLAQGVLHLPHTRSGAAGASAAAAMSTPLPVRLKAGDYTIRVSDFYNMSYLQSNSSFSGAGGMQGPSNRVDLYGLRLLRTR